MWRIKLQKIVRNLLHKLRKLYMNGTVIWKFFWRPQVIDILGNICFRSNRYFTESSRWVPLILPLHFWQRCFSGSWKRVLIPHSRSFLRQSRGIPASRTSVISIPKIVFFPSIASRAKISVNLASRAVVKSRIFCVFPNPARLLFAQFPDPDNAFPDPGFASDW